MNGSSIKSPLGYRTRKFIRQSSIAVIAIGVPAAIFGVMAKLDPSITVHQLLGDWRGTAALTAMFLLYTLYLILVVNHGLLLKDLGSIGRLSTLMPFLLLAAYITMPLEFWMYGRPTLMSSVAFIVVYSVWFLDGLFSQRQESTGEPDLSIAENISWIVVDFLAIVALGFDIRDVSSQYSSGAHSEYAPITWWGIHLRFKDAAVALSVIGCLTQMKILHAANKRPFPDAIRTFVRALHRHSPGDRGINEARTWFDARLPTTHTVRVFDFGSGDSHRTLKLLELLGRCPNQIKLDRFDISPAWKEYGPTGESPGDLADASFGSSLVSAATAVSQADVVVASHSLYDEKAVKDFGRLLKNARPGTIVLLRGGSPESFLAPIVIYRTYSWMKPFFSPFWDSIGKDFLKSSTPLRDINLDNWTLGKPVVIGQSLLVDAEMVLGIEQALEFMYGRRVAMTIKRMIRMALDRASPIAGVRRVSFPNPDLVYFLEIPAPVPQVSSPQPEDQTPASEMPSEFEAIPNEPPISPTTQPADSRSSKAHLPRDSG